MANFILSMGAISLYFAKYYHVATSIITTGLPIAIMFFAPFTQLLIDTYGWRGTMLLLAAMQFHSVAAAAALRPINQNAITDVFTDESLKKPTTDDLIRTCLSDIFNVSLIRNRSYVNITIIHAFIGYDFNGWMVYLISIALSKGLTLYNAANVVLISGIGIFIIRVILAVLSRSDKLSRYLLYFGSVAMTLAYAGMYWAASFISLSIQSCLLGIGYGILGTEVFIVMNDCVNQEDIVGAVAWMTLMDAVGYLTGGYVTGEWNVTIICSLLNVFLKNILASTYDPGPAAPGLLIIWKNILGSNMLQDHIWNAHCSRSI